MKHTPVFPDVSQFPGEFHTLLRSSPVFDSSCPKAAQIWFLKKDGGLYLKSAPAGTLKTEADMLRTVAAFEVFG